MDDQKHSKGRVIGFRASPALVAQIEAVATEKDWTLAHVARKAVVTGLGGMFASRADILADPKDAA